MGIKYSDLFSLLIIRLILEKQIIMSKFTLLEEGRIHNNELFSIRGGMKEGTLDCWKNTYQVIPNCPGYPSYSICPQQYMSCNAQTATSNIMCNASTGGYNGPAGPAGLQGRITESIPFIL